MSVNGGNEIVDLSVRNNFPTGDRKSCKHFLGGPSSKLEAGISCEQCWEIALES